MSNVNSGQIYQYINQQTTHTFLTYDQYRSWILDKLHRQTVHNQALTLHTAYQSELQWRISMDLKENVTTKWKSDMKHTDYSGKNNEVNYNLNEHHRLRIRGEM